MVGVADRVPGGQRASHVQGSGLKCGAGGQRGGWGEYGEGGRLADGGTQGGGGGAASPEVSSGSSSRTQRLRPQSPEAPGPALWLNGKAAMRSGRCHLTGQTRCREPRQVMATPPRARAPPARDGVLGTRRPH